MAITNEYQPKAIRIKVTKGNGLQSLITEIFDADAFYPTTDTGRGNHGLFHGLSRDYVVRVQKQIAVLGAAQDYVEIEYDTVATGTTSWAMLVKSMFVDLLDFSGVPNNIQHTVFGEDSPFVQPEEIISTGKGAIKGVDRQVIQATVNVAPTVDGTAKAQKIRGASDSRVTVTATGATAAVTKCTLKLKPNPDGVFVIPAGARIWVGSGTPT